MNPNDFNKDGKIENIEKAFKDDKIAKKVAYMIATSHEYKKPNTESAIRLVKNYDWELSTEKIKNMQGIDKPVKKEKVDNMVKIMKKVDPFIVVNQFQGIRPQTQGKKILLDGHHRKACCIEKGIDEVPVYKGTYTGKAEIKASELIEKMAQSRFTTEDAKKYLKELKYDIENLSFSLNDFAYGMNVELEHGKELGDDTNVTNDDPLKTAKITLAHMKESSDYYKELKKMEDKLEKKASSKLDTILGTALLAGGLGTINKQVKRGNITGREKLYHNTHKANAEKIREEGFIGNKATDTDTALTPEVLTHLHKGHIKNKTYFARKKSVANGVGDWVAKNRAKKTIEEAKINHLPNETNFLKELLKEKSNRETLVSNIPTWKMKEVNNPELLGAKSLDDFISKYESRVEKGKAEKLSKPHLIANYNGLGRKGTAVIRGNVSPEYVKGSDKYKKPDLVEVADYVKNNPDRFKEGLLNAALGLTSSGVGAALLASGFKKTASVNIPKALLGAGLVAASSNAVLGKKTLYQGTSKENWESIKKDGLKANRGGTGASKSVGNSAYQKNSEGKVHLTALRPAANTYAAANTPEIKAKKEELQAFKERAFNLKVKQGDPGKSEVEYKLKRGHHKPKIEKAKELERELRDLNIAQRNDLVSVFLDPSLKTDGKTIKVKMNYNKWKNDMEQDREGAIFFKKEMNKYLKGNNPIVKNMAARGSIDVSPEEIAGSDATIKDRAKNTASNMVDYIKENPARFIGGAATGGIGANMIAKSILK